MVGGQTAQLCEWLHQHRIDLGERGQWLHQPPTEHHGKVAAVQVLNEVESRFDDLLTHQAVDVRWDGVRDELALHPCPNPAWQELTNHLAQSFAASPYQGAQEARAQRVWRDFLLVQEDQVSSLQVPAGWVAALDYLLQCLYFISPVTQEEIGRLHSVSTSTVGLRFRALVDGLNIHLYDHPARKRLLAYRAIYVDSGRMSEKEFNDRLLRGEFD